MAIDVPVRNPDIVRDELVQLKKATGKGWREIAQLEQYSPIPFGTLSSIYNGYPVPKRWYKKLGIPAPVLVPACPVPGCTEPYRHLHGMETFDPTTQAIYDPTAQDVYPKGAPVYDPATQHPTKNRKPYTRRERPHFDALVVARVWMGLEV